MRISWVSILALTFLIAAMPVLAQSAPPPQTLPKQDIVFVIDNSGSMEQPPTASDPLRLRGIAAGLILDAVEVSSEVQAGLVIFSDDADTDGKLHKDTTQIRQRLRPDRLDDAHGSTNMLDALTKALAILSGSTADRKRIVLITDGAPNPGQGPVILKTLVPAAQSAHIQLFALGLSENVDQKFLDEITVPTGGRTLIAKQHPQLLDLAKQLVSDRDNVYTLAKESLPSTTNEYAFKLGSGVDRARLTVILDQPTAFTPDEIQFTLSGPDPGIAQPYAIRPQGTDRLAAWTVFFSKSGDYKLNIKVTKPGAAGHGGARLILEALSDLRVQLTLTPAGASHRFGEQVRVDVAVATPTNSNPTGLNVTGTVGTSSGGSSTITFNGVQGTFEVPAVAGVHTVAVKVATSLSQAEARVEYDAVPPVPAELKSSREHLRFIKAFGPADPRIEESFKLSAEFAPGTSPHPVSFSFTLVSPAGFAELATAGGGVLQPGIAQYTIPPGGLDLVLRLKMDPKLSLPKKGGKFQSVIQISSTETRPLTIPFEFEFRVPRFEIVGKRDAFSLWWDPHRQRIVHLGSLRTDLAAKSNFFVVLPEAIYAPDQGPKIADLELRIGGDRPEPEHFEEGKIRYGPLELDPGKDFGIDLVVTPTALTGWEALPARPQTIEVQLASELGMDTKATPVFWSIGGRSHHIPLLGIWSRHGSHWGRVLALLLALAIIGSVFARRIRSVRNFWPYRPGSDLTLRAGAIQIGEVEANAGAALVLPNSGSLLDNTTIGYVYNDPKGQRVEDSSGYLQPGRARLAPGDVFSILDPADPTSTDTLWEIEYTDYELNEGGDLVVGKSPAPWTVKRLFRSLAVNAAIIVMLALILSSGYAAALAYRLPFVEAVYIHLLQP
jgi:uncharacterized protein YegL